MLNEEANTSASHFDEAIDSLEKRMRHDAEIDKSSGFRIGTIEELKEVNMLFFFRRVIV